MVYLLVHSFFIFFFFLFFLGYRRLKNLRFETTSASQQWAPYVPPTTFWLFLSVSGNSQISNSSSNNLSTIFPPSLTVDLVQPHTLHLKPHWKAASICAWLHNTFPCSAQTCFPCSYVMSLSQSIPVTERMLHTGLFSLTMVRTALHSAGNKLSVAFFWVLFWPQFAHNIGPGSVTLTSTGKESNKSQSPSRQSLFGSGGAGAGSCSWLM